MELSQQQGQAVKAVVKWFREESEDEPTCGIAGFAGTGKSTILPCIIDDLGIPIDEVAFAAPTGKAAKVMGTKLRSQGYPSAAPSTVHSLIYQPKPMKAEMMERELQELEVERGLVISGDHPDPTMITVEGGKKALNEIEKKIEILKKDLERAYDESTPRFQLNPESRLITGNIKLLVLDEASMVDVPMAEDLLSFGVPILYMGDPGQLPPVEGPCGFDLHSARAMLTEIHRQAADNPVIHIATLIRRGERPALGDYGDGVMVIRRREDKFTLDLDREAQVICGTNKTRWKLTSRMRKEAGFIGLAPQEGEPLIMCKNSKQHPTLVNGTPMFSAIDHDDLSEGESRFLIDVYDEEGERRFKMFAYQGLFEEHMEKVKGFSSASKSAAFRSRITDNHLDFGWAITCHKSQGSQWDEVIVHDESGVFREDCDKWLYTAVTRTAGGLILIADE